MISSGTGVELALLFVPMQLPSQLWALLSCPESLGISQGLPGAGTEEAQPVLAGRTLQKVPVGSHPRWTATHQLWLAHSQVPSNSGPLQAPWCIPVTPGLWKGEARESQPKTQQIKTKQQ